MRAFFSKNKWITGSCIVGLTLLSGCSITPPKSLMDIQAGETFTLKQPVTFRAENVRQYIQFGELTGGGFNQSEQHCRIELYEMPKKAYMVQPQNFKISRVQLDEEEIARNQDRIMFAANQYTTVQSDVAPNLMLLARDDYQRPETMDLVHLYLKSDTQPNVYRLTCSGALSNGDPKDAPRSYRPDRNDINRILGNVGSIHP
ncbi:hypothetical protein QCB45_08000 [Thiomicrorhabdus sp. ZW0627]|uniref:hypothetical protein n=1 Tax=Thiomicrorhabdus sp. ZW0627 TaxID=3039774 RepID=UPI002436B06F|nr:hypothetical protein [Thiomicrorhabdus sp. ZW0627]MDG6774273.1 hypothetical protein [Thiomicrorhabdus sp. ZW0627]